MADQRRPVFDKQDQFDKIATNPFTGESVIAVYDAIGAGSGFLGLTNIRVIIQDNSFIGGKMALISVPYKNVASVGFVSDKSMMGKFFSSSSISFFAGAREYRVDFRGEQKALHAHNVILWGSMHGTA